jgi:hypothetical protein
LAIHLLEVSRSFTFAKKFQEEFRMRSVLFRAACLLLLGTPLVARADTTYDFQATGSGFESSGTFTVAATATPGVFDVTNITGKVNGTAITGLIPGSYDPSNPTENDNGDFYFDNVFYSTEPYLDNAGLGIDVGNSGYQVNFFYNSGPDSYWFWDNDNNTNFALDSFTVAVAPTPEPSSLLLLGTGVLGFAGAIRRRMMA